MDLHKPKMTHLSIPQTHTVHALQGQMGVRPWAYRITKTKCKPMRWLQASVMSQSSKTEFPNGKPSISVHQISGGILGYREGAVSPFPGSFHLHPFEDDCHVIS